MLNLQTDIVVSAITFQSNLLREALCTLKTDSSLMQIKSIAENSCNTFDLHLGQLGATCLQEYFEWLAVIHTLLTAQSNLLSAVTH